MSRTEALTLLNQYAPGTKPGRSAANTLMGLIESRGDRIGLDNVTGDWVILSGQTGENIIVRVS